MATSEGFYANVTLIDVQLASAYYPILVDMAKHKRCVAYGELVERAKAEYPGRPVVQKAIAVSTGRRLDVVRMFTEQRDLPDLSSLVINKESGECGTGFTKHFDPVVAREKVFAFDWSTVSLDFDGFVKHTETAIKPRKKVKEPRARELMAAYYQKHRGSLPDGIRQSRELIVGSTGTICGPTCAMCLSGFLATPTAESRSCCRTAGRSLPPDRPPTTASSPRRRPSLHGGMFAAQCRQLAGGTAQTTASTTMQTLGL